MKISVPSIVRIKRTTVACDASVFKDYVALHRNSMGLQKGTVVALLGGPFKAISKYDSLVVFLFLGKSGKIGTIFFSKDNFEQVEYIDNFFEEL